MECSKLIKFREDNKEDFIQKLKKKFIGKINTDDIKVDFSDNDKSELKISILSKTSIKINFLNLEEFKYDIRIYHIHKISFLGFNFDCCFKLKNIDNVSNLIFNDCVFNNEMEIDVVNKLNIDFLNCTFKNYAFKNIKNCENLKIKMTSCKIDKLCFNDIKFKKIEFLKSEINILEIENDNILKFDGINCYDENNNFYFNKKYKKTISNFIISCYQCIFKDYINFKDCIFEKEVNFKDCIFEKEANFSNAKFIDNVYFNNSTFLNFVDFHECEFDGVANFFGVKFCDLVNFSSVVFKDFNKTIFINLDIDNINLEKIKKSKKLQNLEKDKEKIKLLNGFRDSFRVIKHSLSSVNNSLESSKFHKLELYVKEIELELKSNLDFRNHFSTTTKKPKTKDYNLFKQEKINWKRLIHLFLTILFIVIFYFTLDVKVTDEFLIKDIYFIAVLETIIILSRAVGLVCLFKIFKFFIKISKYTFNMLIKTLKSCYDNFLYRKNITDYSLYLIKRTINKTYIITNNKTKKYINFTEFIDASKLKLYRITSEHHTNFTKILNFTILMVAIFGMSCYFISFFINKFDFDISFFINKFDFNIIFIVLNMIFVSLFSYIIMKVGDNFYTILLLFTCLIIELSIFLTKNECLFFILFYISLVAFGFCCFICKNNLVICLTRYIAYSIFFMILVSKPTLIIPALNLNSFNESRYLEKYLKSDISTVEINKFLDKNNTIIKDEILNKKIILENFKLLKNYEKNLPENLTKAIKKDEILSSSFKSINFIYSIILGLCLYSLQKTARRNSIVPN